MPAPNQRDFLLAARRSALANMAFIVAAMLAALVHFSKH